MSTALPAVAPSACLLRLSEEPLSSWSAAEKQLLCSRLAMLMMQEASSASANGQLVEAAKHLISEVQGEFQNLETVWQSEGQQAAFCSLPSVLVLRVLQCSKLSVSCEGTVLVPALSWLRTAGKDAPLQERRQVLHAVCCCSSRPGCCPSCRSMPLRASSC